MLGYFENPEATEDTLRDGWLHTGDFATFDTNGHIHIKDRKKDLIKNKGLQVSPSEVEAVIEEVIQMDGI